MGIERQPIEVFFSYSREDKPLRDKLEVHLSGLKQQGVISSWHDREIVAGSEWEEEIDRHMRTADVILLLISPAFVASTYGYEIELPYAMARHEAEEARVVPILLQEVVGWQKLPFAKLQVYPSGATPLADWRPQRKAFENYVLSDNKGAIADLDQAIKLKPDYADAYYIRGDAYYSLGDSKKVIADYDRAIKLKTDLANAFYGRGNARSA